MNAANSALARPHVHPMDSEEERERLRAELGPKVMFVKPNRAVDRIHKANLLEPLPKPSAWTRL